MADVDQEAMMAQWEAELAAEAEAASGGGDAGAVSLTASRVSWSFSSAMARVQPGLKP